MRVLLLVVMLCGCGDDAAMLDLSGGVVDLALAPVADGGVACETGLCHPERSEVCCVEPGFQFCGSAEACSAGISLYCDGPGDCAGGACCRIAASTVGCAATCAGAIVCHADADCPTATPHCCGELSGRSGHLLCAASCT